MVRLNGSIDCFFIFSNGIVGFIEGLQITVKLGFNGRADHFILFEELMDGIGAFDLIGEELAGHLKGIPFCDLNPGFVDRDDVDGHRKDVVAQHEVAPCGDCDLGDAGDEGRGMGTIKAGATTCKSFGRVNCELITGDLIHHFLSRRSEQRTMSLDAILVMIHKGSYTGRREISVSN